MTKINVLLEKINGGENALFHELYGTEAGTLKVQAERYADLMGEFEKTFGGDDVQLLVLLDELRLAETTPTITTDGYWPEL